MKNAYVLQIDPAHFYTKGDKHPTNQERKKLRKIQEDFKLEMDKAVARIKEESNERD